MSDISPTKVGLFVISRELQFLVCNHREECASPYRPDKGRTFLKERNEVQRTIQ